MDNFWTPDSTTSVFSCVQTHFQKHDRGMEGQNTQNKICSTRMPSTATPLMSFPMLSTHLTTIQFLGLTKHIPASGPLHLLFLHPGMLYPPHICLALSSFHLGLCFNITSIDHPILKLKPSLPHHSLSCIMISLPLRTIQQVNLFTSHGMLIL